MDMLWVASLSRQQAPINLTMSGNGPNAFMDDEGMGSAHGALGMAELDRVGACADMTRVRMQESGATIGACLINH